MLVRFAFLALASIVAPLPALALDSPARDSIDALIEAQAKANHVPASLVHRVVKRESNYNPGAVGHGGALGLMQIKHATARGLGYKGSAQGLLDAKTNLTYAVAYLAGAYRTAKGNEVQAYSYYAKGYYYAAKRQGVSTDVAELDDKPEAPAPTGFAASPLGQLFLRGFARPATPAVAVASADPAAAPVAAVPASAAPSPAAVSAPFAAAQGGTLGAAPQPAAPATALAYAAPAASAGQPVASEAQAAAGEAVAEEPTISVPLPPRRPSEFRHFVKKVAPAAPQTAEVTSLPALAAPAKAQ